MVIKKKLKANPVKKIKAKMPVTVKKRPTSVALTKKNAALNVKVSVKKSVTPQKVGEKILTAEGWRRRFGKKRDF